MAFPYKHVLLVGATSGIGKAMADKLLASGIHVTAVGRRKDRLDEFVSTHGADKASSLVFDIAKLDEVQAFAESALKAHPTIDCIFLNAGVQYRYNFADPSTVDLPRFNREITTNFSSFVALTHAFLPHLLSQKSPTSIIYTGTHLSLVPAFAMPAYSASKAALDAFILCIREQLRNNQISIIHLSPPVVQTELHDFEMGEEAGRKLGMPVGQFAEIAWKELGSNKKDIFIGNLGGNNEEQFMEIVERRQAAFGRLSDLLWSMSR